MEIICVTSSRAKYHVSIEDVDKFLTLESHGGQYCINGFNVTYCK